MENNLELKRKEIVRNWKNELNRVNGEDVGYYVMWYDNKTEPVIKKIPINEEIGRMFVKTLKNNISELNEDNIDYYGNLDGEINDSYEIIKVSEVPNAEALVAKIIDVRIFLERNELDKAQLDKAQALKFIVRLGNFYGFGPIKRVTLMKERNKKLNFYLDESMRFSLIEHDFTVYSIPEKFSGIIFHDHIIIQNENEFEGIFKYHERILSAIKDKASLTNSIFSDPDNFTGAMESDSTRARKVYMGYSGENGDKITVESLITFCKKYSLDINLDLNDPTKISFENSNAWHVVHAISEDYFTGDRSGKHYVAKVKKRMN